MKVSEVIIHLESKGSWVNWGKTRDVVLFGDTDKEITKIGVCWVASIPAIEQAIESRVNFIISHENLFYLEGSCLDKGIKDSVSRKKELLSLHGITVYRCHDVWDKIPNVGVADTWAKDIGFEFIERDVTSFNSYAYVNQLPLKEVAEKVVNALKPNGINSVQVIGDITRVIERIAIGTGAATDIFSMLEFNPDVFVVSDDGIKNWIEVQWAIDNDLCLIIVNHACCEISGLKELKYYLEKEFVDTNVEYLDEGFDFTTIVV